VDLGLFDTELVTNYTAPVHLTKAFLPSLIAQNKPTALMYTTSGLAVVPLGRCPGYCATKAALHHFLIPLRTHLKETNVRVIEIAPPAVQTELHDEAVQPGIGQTPADQL
jgi:short-subunit dehydrogenase involved in D-alanine esterification of teichoic acids